MIDLNSIKEVLSDPSRPVPYNYTLILVAEELEAARSLIKAQERYDKNLHRYNAVISGASEEMTTVKEAGDLLVSATSQLEEARTRYRQVIDDKH